MMAFVLLGPLGPLDGQPDSMFCYFCIYWATTCAEAQLTMVDASP